MTFHCTTNLCLFIYSYTIILYLFIFLIYVWWLMVSLPPPSVHQTLWNWGYMWESCNCPHGGHMAFSLFDQPSLQIVYNSLCCCCWCMFVCLFVCLCVFDTIQVGRTDGSEFLRCDCQPEMYPQFQVSLDMFLTHMQQFLTKRIWMFADTHVAGKRSVMCLWHGNKTLKKKK